MAKNYFSEFTPGKNTSLRVAPKYPKSLIDENVYIHSNAPNFMRSIGGDKSAIRKAVKGFVNHINDLSKSFHTDIVPFIKEVEKAENSFVEDFTHLLPKKYHKSNIKTKKRALIEFLDQKLIDSKSLWAEWEKAKVGLKVFNEEKFRDRTKKIEMPSKVNSKQETAKIKQQEKINQEILMKEMSKFGNIINEVDEAYQKLSKKGIKHDSNFYQSKMDEMKKFTKDKIGKESNNRDKTGIFESILSVEEDKRREHLNKIFKEFIGLYNRNLGWLWEPFITQAMIPIFGVDQVEVIGNKKMQTVVDIVVKSPETDVSYGVNVKSHENNYEIWRRTPENAQKVLRDYTKDKGKIAKITYLKNNLLALSKFNAGYSSEYEAEFAQQLKYFKDLEKRFFFLQGIRGVFDKIKDDLKGEDKDSFYSVLIATKGGYIWTSEILKEIGKNVSSIFKQKQIIESKKRVVDVSYSQDMEQAKGYSTTKLKNRYYRKRELLKAKNFSKKATNKKVYSFLKESMKDPVYSKYRPLITIVKYKVNIAQAKENYKKV